MATVCSVCGQRLARTARTCHVCGEPVDAALGAASTSRVLAPSAARHENIPTVHDPDPRAGPPPTDTVLPRRVRLLVLVGLVIVGLALGTTYAALRSSPQDRPDDASYGLVRTSREPALRWQRQLAQVAPNLRCPPRVPTDDPRHDSCVVTASATTRDVVVVSVQHSEQSEVIGLSRADGTVGWHRRARAGSTYDCVVLRQRLWCLTVPLIYQVVHPDTENGSSDGSFDVYPMRSAAYRSSTLIRLDPATGAVLSTSPVPGSTSGAAFAGVGFGGFYVVGRGPGAAGTVARFSLSGDLQWRHLMTVIRPHWGYSVANSHAAAPQVYELGGRAVVSLSEVTGRLAVFMAQGGVPVRSAPGHVVTVLGTTVVTQVGSGVLSVGNRQVPENAVAVLAADDRSGAEPVLVTQYSPPDADADPTSDAAPVVFLARSPADPIRTSHPLPEGDEPVAYCGGVMVTAMTNVFTGYDSPSGTRLWVAVTNGGFSPQVRCTGDDVVIANEYSATAFSLKSGARIWTVTYPFGSTVTASGFGDPQDGLVVGPSNTAVVGAGTSVSYLR